MACRYDGELLLREDQLLMGAWRQKAVRKKKELDSMFGDDITDALGMSVRRAPTEVCGHTLCENMPNGNV